MLQATHQSQAQLEQAFELFNQLSGELDDSYHTLQDRVSALSSELATKRRERLRGAAEKDRLLARLTSLVSVLPGGLLILDKNQIVRDANPRALELLGSSLLGEHWPDLLELLSLPDHKNRQEYHLRNGKRVSLESRPLDRHGEQVILVTDISDIQSLQDQLQSKRRLTALGEMAAQLAHQIRTPLSSTTLYLSQLARHDLPTDKRDHIAQRLQSQLGHMGHIIDGMLSFVRGANPMPKHVLLSDILATFQHSTAPTLEAANSTLLIPSVDDSLTVYGDEDELAGALSNLAMNAMEASGGPVVIELWVGALNAKWLQIRVRDNGPGIPAEIRERIFDPFFTTKTQGTGLGLAVVEQTVSAHGGKIIAQNAPSGGTDFLIDLPIVANDAITCGDKV